MQIATTAHGRSVQTPFSITAEVGEAEVQLPELSKHPEVYFSSAWSGSSSWQKVMLLSSNRFND